MRRLTYTFGTIVTLMLLLAAAPPESPAQTMDDKTYTYLLFDQLEYAPDPSEQPVSLEATGWAGGDLNRLWLRVEGEQSTLEREGDTEIEALYGRFITPFFDAVVGPRLDRRWGEGTDTRGLLAVGLQGLAPYGFEVEPTLYVSHEGDVSAQLSAAYHILFTQRLVLEPEVELKAAVEAVPEWGVGAGVNGLDLDLRLRYEFHRKFAPYVGYSQHWTFGKTADLARADGNDPSSGAFVFGVRVWR
jgi:copper resistance protein B